MNVLIRNLGLAILIAIGSHAALAADATPAGHVMLLTGHGSALSADGGTIRALHKDDAVFSGEMISAAANSYVNLRFTDDSFILLRPNTRMLIEAYAYPPAAKPAEAPQPEAPAGTTSTAPIATSDSGSPTVRHSGFFRLLKGGFRAVSGLIGKIDREEYRVSTPVATIGIRGTDYYVHHCDIACENDPLLAALIDDGELPPDIDNSTLVGVYQGAVLVQSLSGQSTQVEAGQYLLTLADGSQYLLPDEPQFLHSTPFPDPTTFCAVNE